MKFASVSALANGLLSAGVALAEAVTGTISNGPFPEELNGSNFTYPYPVNVFTFQSQQQELEMAFMDIKPIWKSNDKTMLLLHGKNFCGPTWSEAIKPFLSAGYRIIVPDQIGFCKSSKPDSYQFSLNQLAQNTRGLLDALDIEDVIVVGHSLGGMLGFRFALQYPDAVQALILVNPIGLEDYVDKGVPYIPMDHLIAMEAASTYDSIYEYEKEVYFLGQWHPTYNTWVRMLANIYNGPKRDAYIKNQAQIVDMVLTSPVVQYLKRLRPKTLLLIGQHDKTAVGSQWAPPDVAATLGHFDKLSPNVAAHIPQHTLYWFPYAGHAPQLSDPNGFQKVVLFWLKR